MRPFQFARVEDVKAAIHAHTGGGRADDVSTSNSPNQYLAGGTTLLDLMKLDVMRPARVIDINALQQTNSAISVHDDGDVVGQPLRIEVGENLGLFAVQPGRHLSAQGVPLIKIGRASC